MVAVAALYPIDAGPDRGQRRLSMPRRVVERRAQIATWPLRVLPPLPRDASVPTIVQAYLDTLEREDSPSLIDARSIAHLYLIDAFRDRLAVDLRVADVIAWVTTLVGLGLSKKYVRKIHGFLRAALEIARGRGLIESNPAARLPPGVLPENETRPGFDPALELLTLSELRSLLCDQSIPRYRRLLWALLALCGMRLGEALALTYADIDFEARPLAMITISKAWASRNRRLQSTKTSQVRCAPAHASLVLPLILEMRALGFAEIHDRAPELTDLLIAHPEEETGAPTIYPDNSALRHFKDALSARGLAPRRLHSLRHLFDTLLAEAGADERTIEAITHPPKRQAKGVRRYIHTSWQARCDAVSRLQGSLQLDLFGGVEDGGDEG